MVDRQYYDARDYLIKLTKAELSKLALVNRRWAILCQKEIFHEVTFDWPKDFNQFVALASHRCSRISLYVRHVWLTISGNSLSLHAIVPCFPHHLLGHSKISVSVSAKTGARFAQLPRSMPRRPLEAQTLNIHGGQFKSFPHLARYIWEQPVFVHTIATWDCGFEQPPSIPEDLNSVLPPQAQRRTHFPSEWTAQGSRAPWTVIILALATHVDQFGAKLGQHDCRTFTVFFCSLRKKAHGKMWDYVSCKVPNETGRPWGERSVCLYYCVTHSS